MRRAVLVLLTACVDVEPAARCGDGIVDDVEPCDDGNATSGDGCSAACAAEARITIGWQFVPSLAGPATDACPASVATVELVGRNAVRSYPCAQHRGDLLAPVGATVFARLRSATGEVLAESIPQLPAKNGATVAFHADAGYLHLAWQLRDAHGLVATCPANAPPILLTIGTRTQQLPCAGQGAVYSPPLVAGSYDVTLASFRGAQTIVGVPVGANDAVTELAIVIP